MLTDGDTTVSVLIRVTSFSSVWTINGCDIAGCGSRVSPGRDVCTSVAGLDIVSLVTTGKN